MITIRFKGRRIFLQLNRSQHRAPQTRGTIGKTEDCKMASMFVDYDPRNGNRDAEPFVLREVCSSTRFRLTAIDMVELKRQIVIALKEHADHLSDDHMKAQPWTT